MGKEPNPTLVVLGSAMRRYREAAGITLTEMAKLINYSIGHLSNVETAQKTPRRELVILYGEALNASESLLELYGLLAYESHPVESFTRFMEAERHATVIHKYELAVIPGLLQTENYARALLAAGRPNAKPEEIDDLVIARMERQTILTGDAPPALWLVLDETVLMRPIGGDEVMAAQFDRLIEAAARPGITIQVIPLATGAHAGLDSSFTILSFPTGPDIAYSEDSATGHFHERPELVKALAESYEALRVYALPPTTSLEMIRKMREEIANESE
jgi:transcriptional regulator with XRE-family HTH domain